MTRHTGGGSGTNQYSIKNHSVRTQRALKLDFSHVVLDSTQQTWVCGTIWGTNCKAQVKAPTFSHSNHPSPKSLMASLPLISSTQALDYWGNRLLNSGTELRSTQISALLKNPACGPNILNAISDSNRIGSEQRRGAWAHLNFPPHKYRTIINKDQDSYLFSSTLNWQAITSNPNCPADVLTQLAERRLPLHDSSDYVLRTIAQHANTPLDVLHQLTHCVDDSVITKTLSNPHYPLEDAISLFNRRSLGHRALLQRPDCPSEVLTKLGLDSTMTIRNEVARHPNTPVDTLSVVGKSSRTATIIVLQRSDCPEDVTHFALITYAHQSDIVDMAKKSAGYTPKLQALEVLSL